MKENKCKICGASDEIIDLFEAISIRDKGLIKICELCSKREGLPIIKKPTEAQLKKAEERPRYFGGYKPQDSTSLKTEKEFTLRKGVEKGQNQYSYPMKKGLGSELIDNFGWVIMVARRKKKLTQEDLAREIGEPIENIKKIEEGILIENYKDLINKLEKTLGIQIKKWSKDENITEPANLKFDLVTTQKITIGDLKRMKEELEK
ncbi:MAG: hypothetical protein QXU40_02075 [Candidatus Pacearchaeota archaeon]